MTLEVSWDDVSTLSFGLSQCHGYNFRLVCEVALRETVEFANLVKQLLKAHPCLANNQSFSLKPGKALLVMVEAPRLFGAPTRTCSGDC
jgi:hypothetical protein